MQVIVAEDKDLQEKCRMNSLKQNLGFLVRGAALALSLVVWLAVPSIAGNINDVGGAAIKGYDPVAYFTDNRAVPGSDAFTTQYDGATFKFASAEHRDAFLADPEKYLPQYGGFCAYGAAANAKAAIDPEAFTIVNGKLYLNHSKSVQAKWLEDVQGYIASANKNWPTLSQSTVVHE
jgi:YHS domain-containing protein